MMKIYMLAVLLAGFNASYSMEKEPAKPEYVEDARQLSKEHSLYFSLLPKDILGIVQYYRLVEIVKLKMAQAEYYKQALDYIKALAAGEYAELFNNHKFINSLINEISGKFGQTLEEIAQDINTSGTQVWFTCIRPNQVKLLDAAWAGNLAVAQQLIAAEVDVNARSVEHQTALMLAASYGHTEIVKELIVSQADVNAQGKYGNTALIYAAERGYAEVVQLLLGAGANVNARNLFGDPALIESARNGHTEVVKVLLAAGANVKTRNKDCNTALEFAQNKGHKEIVELLEKATNN